MGGNTFLKCVFLIYCVCLLSTCCNGVDYLGETQWRSAGSYFQAGFFQVAWDNLPNLNKDDNGATASSQSAIGWFAGNYIAAYNFGWLFDSVTRVRGIGKIIFDQTIYRFAMTLNETLEISWQARTDSGDAVHAIGTPTIGQHTKANLNFGSSWATLTHGGSSDMWGKTKHSFSWIFYQL